MLAEWVSLVSVPGEGELGASWLHGITRSMLAGAPSFADIAGEISGRLAGRVLIGHVLDFDLAHLAAEFARCGLRFPHAPRSRHLHPRPRAGRPPARIAFPHRLLPGAGCELPRRPHRARRRARATAAVFRAFLQRGAVPDPAKVAAPRRTTPVAGGRPRAQPRCAATGFPPAIVTRRAVALPGPRERGLCDP